MPPLKDLTGMRFGRLLVESRAPNKSRVCWNCICDCGKRVVVFGNSLMKKYSRSCGCLRVDRTVERNRQTKRIHGLALRPEYFAWSAAKQRCHNAHNKDYRRYGARGISMAPEWRRSFMAFYRHVGPRPVGAVLDRIDNSGNYEPGNVRWVTPAESANNRRPPSYGSWSRQLRGYHGRFCQEK